MQLVCWWVRTGGLVIILTGGRLAEPHTQQGLLDLGRHDTIASAVDDVVLPDVPGVVGAADGQAPGIDEAAALQHQATADRRAKDGEGGHRPAVAKEDDAELLAEDRAGRKSGHRPPGEAPPGPNLAPIEELFKLGCRHSVSLPPRQRRR